MRSSHLYISVTGQNNKIFIFATCNGYIGGILCLLYNSIEILLFTLFWQFKQFFILPIMPCGRGRFKNLKDNPGNINKMKLKLQTIFI